jgi:uncharacterized membrane protein
MMIGLIVATVAFGVVHALPAHPGIKGSLKAQIGRAYGPVYGLLSLLLLVAMLWAYRSTNSEFLYATGDWGWWANWPFSLLGFMCLGIFLFRGSWRNMLRYPMAIGVCLWGTGHLLANGDWRSLVFFGGLIFAALAHVVFARRAPFAPSPERQGHNFLSILFGIALYGITTQIHYVLTGMELVKLK